MKDIFVNVGLAKSITYHRSATGLVLIYQRLSHPIDGIYTLITLHISAGGYLEFVIIPSDHYILWLKVEVGSVFSATLDTLVPHTARRINCQKPDTVKLFIEIYENFIKNNGLYLEILPA